MVEDTTSVQASVKVVQEDINHVARDTRGHRFTSEEGRAAAKSKRLGRGAGVIKSLWHCFEEELNMLVPMGGTQPAITKRMLLCRALVDGAIRLNPCAVKAVTTFMVPRGVTVNNTQVNIAGGLLERLAKIEATVLEQQTVPSTVTNVAATGTQENAEDCAREKSGERQTNAERV